MSKNLIQLLEKARDFSVLELSIAITFIIYKKISHHCVIKINRENFF